MSLMRLLTAGKSWAGGKDDIVRYRMTDPRAMPKFGSARNPFRSTAKSGSVQSESQPLAVAANSANHQESKVGARTAPVRRSQESKATPALLPERSVHPGAVRAGTVRALNNDTGAVQLWKAQLGRLASRLFQPRPRPVKRALADSAEAPVQGELSLEKIKVVRNDLSDADLEVVPAKKAIPEPGAVAMDWGERATSALNQRQQQATAQKI